MDQRFFRFPAGFEIVVAIFRQSAKVEDPAVLTDDERPAPRGWLAAVVHACPEESARHETVLGDRLPTDFEARLFPGWQRHGPRFVNLGEERISEFRGIRSTRGRCGGKFRRHGFLVRMQGMVPRIRIRRVIAAHDVHGPPKSFGRGGRDIQEQVSGHDGRAGRILFFGEAMQHFQGAATQRLRPGELLIDQTPREHARVMAIAPHEPAQIAQAFRRKIQLAILVQHQQAQAITGIQERRCRRMMRGPKGVAAHLLQQFDALRVKPIRQGDSDTGEVLVTADAFEFVRLPVKTEALRGVELAPADPQRQFAAVGHAALAGNFRVNPIEIRLFR